MVPTTSRQHGIYNYHVIMADGSLMFWLGFYYSPAFIIITFCQFQFLEHFEVCFSALF